MQKLTNFISRLLVACFCASSLAGVAHASAQETGMTILDRDLTYERNLRWEASNDKTITPAKVIRWMMSYRGKTLSAPSSTEFQPIVNVYNGQTRIIAALAYKF